MAEVIGQPGFLWARRIRLGQQDADGWAGSLLAYGLASEAALEAYLASPAREGFWRELEAFATVQRAERFWGSVDFAVDPG
jgi:hypothetical protein